MVGQPFRDESQRCSHVLSEVGVELEIWLQLWTPEPRSVLCTWQLVFRVLSLILHDWALKMWF